MSDNLFSFLRSRFPDPARAFIVRPDGSVLSYGELVDRTAQYAHYLVSIGVRPGDRIAVHVDKSVECLLVYLAALRAGAVYLPLNSAYTAAEVRYFLGDAEPVLFICRPQDEAAMAVLARDLGIAHLRTLGTDGDGSLPDAVAGHPTAFADVPRESDDLAAILYTSGTTGRSKGAMLTHDNLRSNCETLRSYWRFSGEDRLLHALPIFHTHGLFVATNLVLASGASMIFLPKFDVRQLIAKLPDATVLMGVPTFYSRLLEEADFTRELAAHMRLFVSGSAPLSIETAKAFLDRTGHAILERYGMTETNMNTSNPYDGDRVVGSVGMPLPGISLRIGAAEASGDSPHAIGVVEVRGPNVFKGYWRMPEKTAEDFTADGFFITGDLGYVDERGYVFLVGRAKDLIISGGFNIYPAEVEQAIEELPDVAECAVIGVPHPHLGEAVVAVVTSPPGSSPSEAAITTALVDRLARFKQPRKVVFVEEMPRNGMGKIQKKILRETYADILREPEATA